MSEANEDDRLLVKRMEFIEDPVKWEAFMGRLFTMAAQYHKEASSTEFKFATELFVSGLKNESLICFFVYDRSKSLDEPIGFAIALTGINILSAERSFELCHVYAKEEYRGNFKYLKETLSDVMEYKDILGFDLGFIQVSPDLLPLIMSLTNGKLLTNTIGYD